jgi:hypothetical protein
MGIFAYINKPSNERDRKQAKKKTLLSPQRQCTVSEIYTKTKRKDIKA